MSLHPHLGEGRLVHQLMPEHNHRLAGIPQEGCVHTCVCTHIHGHGHAHTAVSHTQSHSYTQHTPFPHAHIHAHTQRHPLTHARTSTYGHPLTPLVYHVDTAYALTYIPHARIRTPMLLRDRASSEPFGLDTQEAVATGLSSGRREGCGSVF